MSEDDLISESEHLRGLLARSLDTLSRLSTAVYPILCNDALTRLDTCRVQDADNEARTLLSETGWSK